MSGPKIVFGSVGTFLGLVILIGSMFLHFWLSVYIKDTIKAAVSVTGPRCPGYKTFRNASETADVYESYYMFNVENPWEFETGNATNLQVTQRGPFTFKLNKYKPEANTSWKTDGTVAFMAQTSYEFLPDKSASGFDDLITTYRMGLFGGLKHIGSENTSSALGKVSLKDFNDCMWPFDHSFLHPNPKYNAFQNITPWEFLLGMNDPMLACVSKKTLGFLDPWVTIMNQPANSTSSTALSSVYSGGKYSTKTKDMKAPPKNAENNFATYLGMKELPWWNSTYANMINGSGGTSLPPGTAAVGHYADMFSHQIYRSATVVGISTEELHGVELVRYTATDASFAAPDQNPGNAAFHITTKGIQPCPPSVQDPIHWSKPYYLDADTDNIKVKFGGPAHELFLADPESYNVFLDIEPHTGALLRVHKPQQASVEFKPHALFPGTHKWPTTLAPVFWVNEHMELSKKEVDILMGDLFFPLKLVKYGWLIGAIFGAVLLLIGVGCCYRGCKSRGDDQTEKVMHYSSPTEKTALNVTRNSAPLPVDGV